MVGPFQTTKNGDPLGQWKMVYMYMFMLIYLCIFVYPSNAPMLCHQAGILLKTEIGERKTHRIRPDGRQRTKGPHAKKRDSERESERS